MRNAIAIVTLSCLVTLNWRAAAEQTPDWGSGIAPFAFAMIGDMPYGAPREPQFARVVAEINRDNDVDFVMHAGDIKAGSERCDDSLILHRFDLYQEFQRAFVYTPGDNEWTDCHRVNNGQYNPLERLAFLRSVFYPVVGQTTGGKQRPVRSQADGGAYPEFCSLFTVDMHVSYLEPVREEDAVAEGWVEKRGRSTVFCRTEIRTPTGRLVTTGSLIYRVGSPIAPSDSEAPHA